MDDDLLRRCQRGDATALGELIRRHQDRLFRVAFRVLRDPARAEDAVADAFAAIWSRCGKWRGERGGDLDLPRRVPGRSRSRPEPAGGGGGSSPGRRTASRSRDAEPCELADRDQQAHRARRLDEAIATLAPEDRVLVHLHYFEGQSLAEIAVVLGRTRDALKMRLSRARARLREALGDGDELF